MVGKITKKFDRAFQWAGEKMGGEAKTTHSDEFRALEAEMNLRIDGAERLHRSMGSYVKWVGKRDEVFGDKEKGLPGAYLGRTMVGHGEDFEADSEYGNSLITVGRANERVASIQEQYAGSITSTWLESLNRSLAMMRDYQTARKKLENRRLTYDASVAKTHKSRREDYRLEEEVRVSKARFEEANEDVLRRMQDIKEAEPDSQRELANLLDAQIDFYDRCAEELRRARGELEGMSGAGISTSHGSGGRASYAPSVHSERRPRQTYSYTDRFPREQIYEEDYEDQQHTPTRPVPTRTASRRAPPDVPTRPHAPSRSMSTMSSGSYTLDRTPSLHQVVNPASLRGQLRPVTRVNTGASTASFAPHYPQQQQQQQQRDQDVFSDRYDDDSADSGSVSPSWVGGDGRVSPATSHGSWGRSAAGASGGYRKAPPPPPPSRAKKPAPPLPPKRSFS